MFARGLRFLLVVGLAFATLAVDAEASRAATQTFTGRVDAAGTKTRVHAFSVGAASAIDASLDWTTTTADLNVVLKDPSGVVRAKSTSTRARPETLHLDSTGAASGTWRLAISARAGATDYALDVSVVEATPGAWDGSVKVWAAENENAGHNWTRTEALGHARKFDAILSSTYPPDYAVSYGGDVAAMKSANPDLLLVAHVNGTHVWVEDDRVDYPASSYLYNAAGGKIRQPEWDTWLMNVFDSKWINRRPAECLEILKLTRYDTCYLDSLATWGLTGNDAMPINPKTGRQMTVPEWLQATTALAKSFRSGIAPRVTWGSGGATGAKYFGSGRSTAERQLLDGLDASVHEGFCRRADAPLHTFYVESVWKQDVEMIRDVEARGKYALPLVKTFASGTTEAKRAVLRYCLATFLLATDGKSMFGFEFAKGDAMAYDPLYDVVLGAPTSAYVKLDGVYQRSFARGRVLVNSTSSTAKVPVDGRTITMPAHTAEILTSG